jgi:hypothetical protein
MNHTNSVAQRKQIFLNNAIEVHGDRYDYSKVVYTRAQEKVEIVCREHGSFWQTPDSHSRGPKCGCPACGKIKCIPKEFKVRLTQEKFLEQCLNAHGNYYSYEKTVYIGKTNNVTITCYKHGDFTQKAENHKNGAGCPECGIEKAHNHFRASTEEFIRKSIKAHGNVYTYSNSVYSGKDLPITITCKKHGDFILDKANYHYLGHKQGCPKCSMAGTSKQEQEVVSFIKSLGLTIIEGDRSIIKPFELDIVIPELKIAIEYNGLYWHSEQAGKDKNYHLSKLKLATEVGYRLIQIFEDEWVNNTSIVKSRLSHILGKGSLNKVFARKLTVSSISVKEANSFFEKHHIQGKCAARLAYGLFNNTELVAAISFGANRFTKEKELELIRFATSVNVVGGFSKLLSFFFKQNPEIKNLTSYSDRRWSVGNVYEKNGFKYAGSSQPGYFYANNEGIRINRVTFQKHKLSSILKVFDPDKSEVENVIANGYFRIFDCGMDKWTLSKV